MLANHVTINANHLRLILLVISIHWMAISNAQSQFKSDSSIISKSLFMQRDCWNKGDISCFMDTYWKSDSLKFIGKDGITYGWDATMSRYKKKYPDKSHMGTLSFDVLEMEYLAPNTMMLVGRWGLQREMGDVGGHFTLIWRRIVGVWVIVTDHSS